MIDVCIYGNENLDESGREVIEALTGETADKHLEDLLSSNPQDAAERFVDLIGKMDYRWAEDDKSYFVNASALLFRLAEMNGFYDALADLKRKLNLDDFPSRARLILCSQ